MDDESEGCDAAWDSAIHKKGTNSLTPEPSLERSSITTDVNELDLTVKKLDYFVL